MFTMFHGFHLVEEYHQWKKENRKEKNPIPVKSIKLLITIAIPLFLWLAPSSLYGLPDINAIEHRVLAIFVFAALLWWLYSYYFAPQTAHYVFFRLTTREENTATL